MEIGFGGVGVIGATNSVGEKGVAGEEVQIPLGFAASPFDKGDKAD